MGLSTHILDTGSGKPATGVDVVLLRQEGTGWHPHGKGTTDVDGRCKSLLGENQLEAGTYRLRFETAPYFAAQKQTTLYPFVEIAFTVADLTEHFHIPLLLTANGYTTYRGS